MPSGAPRWSVQVVECSPRRGGIFERSEQGRPPALDAVQPERLVVALAQDQTVPDHGSEQVQLIDRHPGLARDARTGRGAPLGDCRPVQLGGADSIAQIMTHVQ
jgi:hypothetical protein